jgi:hypothetical protein
MESVMPSARVYAALVSLSDPTAQPVNPPTFQLTGREVDSLLKLADQHTVLPAVLANLKAMVPTADPLGATGPGLPGPASAAQRTDFEGPLAWADAQLILRTGLTLALRRQLAQIGVALAERRIPACVLKGAEFADRLYPSPGLRPFTDIDLLVPESARGEIDKVLADLGYTPHAASMKHATGYAEQSWKPPGAVGGTVEVHWNLVNSPTLRRRVSVRFEDLRFDPDLPVAPWRLARPDASSLLLIATVHAAASHSFDRLQMLWDICQSARSAATAGPLNERWLIDAVRRTGSRLAMSTALHLVGRVLGEPSAGRLLDRLNLRPPGMVVRNLLTRAVVLRGHARRDSIRRQLFRERLKRS